MCKSSPNGQIGAPLTPQPNNGLQPSLMDSALLLMDGLQPQPCPEPGPDTALDRPGPQPDPSLGPEPSPTHAWTRPLSGLGSQEMVTGDGDASL